VTELLQEAISSWAERRPEALAVVLHGDRQSYGELECESNQLARLLRAAGVKRGDRVCLLMPKSPALVVAMLGVLKADAIYVPLDPASPAPRIAKMIASCDDRWILTADPAHHVLNELLADPQFAAAHSLGWMSSSPPVTRIAPQFCRSDLRAFGTATPSRRNSPGDPAQILFTSGSTGVPKGVVIAHSNAVSFLDWARDYFGTSPSDRISWHPPLHFDLSTFDVFGTLRAGATLYPVPGELSLFAHKLAQFIRDAELTQWFSVPSVLNYVAKFDALRAVDFPTVRRVLWCGEVLPTPTLMYWMKRLPGSSFTNLYGPTETTVASSYYTVPECPNDARAEIPIGQACRGEELLVLDESLRPVPPGEVGDLYIGGVGVSLGYWGDPEKTQRAFPQYETPGGIRRRIYRTGDLARVDATGLVYYVGRSDTQIKSRGYRIELGEIEAALHTFPFLKDCAVVAVPSMGFDGMAICCAYVAHNHGAVSATTLRAELTRLVPAYMLPSRWLALDDLPKNPNGKLDRRQLKETFLQPDGPGVAQSALLPT